MFDILFVVFILFVCPDSKVKESVLDTYVMRDDKKVLGPFGNDQEQKLCHYFST